MRKNVWILLLLVWSTVAAACAGAPVTPEARLAAERRLLAPFLRDTEVRCSELLVELTANFHASVSELATDRTRSMRKERGDGYVDTIWTTMPGSPALVVTIGEPMELTEKGPSRGPAMRFLVSNQFRRRVYEGAHAMTLAASTSGPGVVVREATMQARSVSAFRVEDGAVTAR